MQLIYVKQTVECHFGLNVSLSAYLSKLSAHIQHTGQNCECTFSILVKTVSNYSLSRRVTLRWKLNLCLQSRSCRATSATRHFAFRRAPWCNAQRGRKWPKKATSHISAPASTSNTTRRAWGVLLCDGDFAGLGPAMWVRGSVAFPLRCGGAGRRLLLQS